MGLRIFGVRHGEVHNPDGVIYAGLPGFGLSELGRSQARMVGEALRGAPLVAIYASPLDRAVETAGIIGEITGIDVVPDGRLHEWRHWHQFAGLTWDELRTKARDAWDAYTSDPGGVTSGESLAELADRAESWLSDAESAHESGIVLGVTHLEPLRALLLRSLGRPPNDLFHLQIGLGEAVRLRPDPDETALAGEALAVSIGPETRELRWKV